MSPCPEYLSSYNKDEMIVGGANDPATLKLVYRSKKYFLEKKGIGYVDNKKEWKRGFQVGGNLPVIVSFGCQHRIRSDKVSSECHSNFGERVYLLLCTTYKRRCLLFCVCGMVLPRLVLMYLG